MSWASLRSNLATALVGFAVVLVPLEIWFRFHPVTDVQTNDEYRFRTLTGERGFGIPFHAWTERFDSELDVRGYYAKTDYEVAYRFDQRGARWLAAEPRASQGRVVIVLGDSFTYGSGLRYEDSWVRQLEQRLALGGDTTTLLDFAESGADSSRCLEIYQGLRSSIAHDDVLYGLHLNDLVSFGTSEVIRNEMLGTPFDRYSRLVEHHDNFHGKYYTSKWCIK